MADEGVSLPVLFLPEGTERFSGRQRADPAGRFQVRLWFKGYRSGPMMYLRQIVLYTDDNHLSRTFSRSLGLVLGEQLDTELRR